MRSNAKNAKNAKIIFCIFLHFFHLFLPHAPNETTILYLPRLIQKSYKNKNKYETMKILFQSKQKKQSSQPYHENLNTPFSSLFPSPPPQHKIQKF